MQHDHPHSHGPSGWGPSPAQGAHPQGAPSWGHAPATGGVPNHPAETAGYGGPGYGPQPGYDPAAYGAHGPQGYGAPQAGYGAPQAGYGGQQPGYDPAAYGAQGGYGPQPGHDPAAYGAQGGYGPQPGHDPAAYGAQGGYGPQAGYGPQPGYGHDAGQGYGAGPHWQGHAHGHVPAVESSGYGAEEHPIASQATLKDRQTFIERTYLHLALAVTAFVLIETGLQFLPGIERLVMTMIASSASWAVVLALFVGVSWIADRWAQRSTSLGMQYAGLILYTVAEAITFVPLIYIARVTVGGEVIMTAAGVTLAMFAALTSYVFMTKKDFSFMRGMLAVAGMASLGLVGASLLFGFQLGIAFSVGMVFLASGYILFYTSNVLRHYRTNQHVAAALALFSALALLFWYVLRLFMSRD